MTLPELHQLEKTISGLHQGARLLDAVQRLTQPAQPAYLELALSVEPQGLSTGRLPEGGRVRLDFQLPGLVYQPAHSAPVSFNFRGCTQVEIFADLFGMLSDGELNGLLPPGEDLFERVSAGIGSSRYHAPQHSTLLGPALIEIEPQIAQNYWISLQTIFTGIARFKAHLLGLQTPLVVWPHGFDLSTLWFAGVEIDESRFHMNFGFSPRSDGIDYPYLYAYAYPYPPDFRPALLPEGARWQTQGWTGYILPYQGIAAQSDAQGFIEDICGSFYQGLLPAAPLEH